MILKITQRCQVLTKEFVDKYDLTYTNALTDKINKKLSMTSKIKKMGSEQKWNLVS
jgi:hypothetical protein